MNRFTGYEEFLTRWRTSGSSAGAAPAFRQSEVGNRNLRGSAVDTAAYTFVRSQQGFVDSIEPRIRPLVLYLVQEVGLVTYSSCEGHLATASSPFRPAHVGVLPDASAESAADEAQAARLADTMTRWLVAAAHQTMCDLEEPALGVRVIVDELETEVGRQPCLDVWFLPISATPELYFDALPALIQRYRCELDRLLDSGEAADTVRSLCRGN